MSVCAHDMNCPGYGPVHDKAQIISDSDWELLTDFNRMYKNFGSVKNQQKDRTLAGKKRRKNRRAN